MATQTVAQPKLLGMVLVRFGGAFLLLGLLLFLPAGTFAYWHAWLYLAVLMIPMTGSAVWLLRNDPELLERRMHTRERGSSQKLELLFSLVWLFFAFVVPGLDFRYGWSNVPVWLVLVGDGLVLAGYTLFFLVLRENSYASRVVEIAEGQEVIDTGPYALVRHPMYTAVLLMFVFTPMALGSYWAMLSGVIMLYILIKRIYREEAMLSRELAGYSAYMTKVHHRLIPGVW